MPEDRMTVDHVRNWSKGQKLLAMTAYDYSFAKILDEAGVDILHVGDSMGMVVLGLPDTTGVKLSDIQRATESVARARKHALITADLPYGTYDNVEDAVKSSKVLIDAGADAVKLEGGVDILPQIKALRECGIEVQGHLGMLPQRIKEEGSYRKKGKNEAEIEKITNDAFALEEAGVFSFVFELVVQTVAEDLTHKLSVPTIGIGSGSGTTGQIVVSHDVLGLHPWFVPKHVTIMLPMHKMIEEVVKELKYN
jgi:3-methyl-2-oxobutanoate hydroxymethyltransferase